jgi:calcineurin-like phosphoesterase family protein
LDFFTADTHLAHGNILIYCRRFKYMTAYERDILGKSPDPRKLKEQGFKIQQESVERMNAALIDNINAMVRPNDTLWHLGDFCFGPNGMVEEVAKRFRNRINCNTVNLIWGNHDRREISSAFNRTFDKATINIKGQVIVLDHYAHAVWNKSHRGAWMLYGHSHSTAEKKLDEFMPGRRSIDVGVDNAFKVLGEYRPFSFDELNKMFAKKTGHSIDHHEEKE